MPLLDFYRSYFKRDSRIEEFIRHLGEIDPRIDLKKPDKEYEVLIEVTLGFPRLLAYSFFTSEFQKSGSKLIGYHPKLVVSRRTRLLQKILSILQVDNGHLMPYRILDALGVKKFIRPNIYSKSNKVDHEIIEILTQVLDNGPEYLAHLKVSGILIGDLLYDWHMRTRKLATPDLGSEEFKDDFVMFLRAFSWWLDYFDEHKVAAVITTHGVYDQGLPVRIAIDREIQTFLVSGDRNYRLDKVRHFPDLEFLDYLPTSREQFRYKVDLTSAREALQELSEGSSTLDPAHAVVSGFRGNGEFEIFDKSNRFRVLIAAHCFEDAPHTVGSQVFEDFMAWLEFLGEISLQTPYLWLVKQHPFFSITDQEHFDGWAIRFPHIVIIPGDVPNQSLLVQGIDAIYTVYGTITFEAAFNDVLVVNSAKLAPHMNYGFSINAHSKAELVNITLELPTIKKKHLIDKESVIHFYALHHLRCANHWLWRNQTWELLDAIGGYNSLPSNPAVLEFWLRNVYNQKVQTQLTKEAKEFIYGKKYLLEYDTNDYQ